MSRLRRSLPLLAATVALASGCQLLGMNSNSPSDFTGSFRQLVARGGATDVHSHGWGLVFYDGGHLRAVHDPEAASYSPVAESVASSPIRTRNMISHIRYATEGSVCLENVHPFQRELWGIQFFFAHNGDVPQFKGGGRKRPVAWGVGQSSSAVAPSYYPVGDTDSEALFCALLNSLKASYDALPPPAVLHTHIESFCREVVSADCDGSDGDRDCGGPILNFLLGCGQHVQFVYSWPGRRSRSSVWNGLYYAVKEVGKDMHVALIATSPIRCGEHEIGVNDWREMDRGELLMFAAGKAWGHGLLPDVVQRLSLYEDTEWYNLFGQIL